MWRRVVITDIWEEHATSLFGVEEFLRNVGNDIPHYTASFPEDSNLRSYNRENLKSYIFV
jgi:hypothetical protein